MLTERSFLVMFALMVISGLLLVAGLWSITLQDKLFFRSKPAAITLPEFNTQTPVYKPVVVSIPPIPIRKYGNCLVPPPPPNIGVALEGACSDPSRPITSF